MTVLSPVTLLHWEALLLVYFLRPLVFISFCDLKLNSTPTPKGQEEIKNCAAMTDTVISKTHSENEGDRLRLFNITGVRIDLAENRTVSKQDRGPGVPTPM